MIKKILSYLYPITVYKEKSSISDEIKIILYNGEYLLDTTNTNYSYGSLQKVLKKGLLTIGQDSIQQKEQILLLGVAGGSVVKTLVHDFNYTNTIVGVELDATIITLANQYFDLNKIPNFNCIIDDAQNYISNSTQKFDLIIIDIFTDKFMPEFLFESRFLTNCKNRLNSKGHIIFNMMWVGTEKWKKIDQFMNHFSNENYSTIHLKSVEHYNDLFIINALN